MNLSDPPAAQAGSPGPAKPAATAPTLAELALAALALPGAPAGQEGPEAAWLRQLQARTAGHTLADWAARPPPADRPLRALAATLGLVEIEALAVALACRVEADALLGRTLAWLQAPLAAARPSIGLMLAVAEALGLPAASPALVDGMARRSGLLLVEDEQRPLHEQALRVPLPLVLALAGQPSRWPGVTLQPQPGVAVAPSLQAGAQQQAAVLQASRSAALVVRSGQPREARAACCLLARALGRQAAVIEGELPTGLGPWLGLAGALPVWCAELAPGETRPLPTIPGYTGPWLVATALDGGFDHEGDPLPEWAVPRPTVDEREQAWARHLPPQEARALAHSHRHALAQIDHLAGLARAQQLAQMPGAMPSALRAEQARAMPGALRAEQVHQAARTGATSGLGTLAQRVPDAVADSALVVSDELRCALDALRERCLRREGLVQGLGPSAQARYRPGVRALFAGASGTGKTLAVAWLATQLGLPLYRVDLAAVASKYIGETEKNLAQLFARAEHSEVVLLFDEADALFGKRTDVKDSNDRFANQQTNYLLQRIESFDGIAVLTSNSRSRFDSAFTRRLDAIIEFPLPGPQERHALWRSHLGERQGFSALALNRLAANCELAGGHIRNVVLAAAARARGPLIEEADLLAALAAEYAKLARPMPAGLRQALPRGTADAGEPAP